MSPRGICIRTLTAAAFTAAACSVGGEQAQRDQSARDPPQQKDSGPVSASTAPLDSLVAKGEAIYWRGQYDSARLAWQDALQTARALADSATEARVLTWLGLAAWRRGDYAQARRQGEQALAMKLRLKLTAELSKSYNALGLLAWNEGRLTEAASLFHEASETARAAQDTEGVAKASGNMALVHTETGEFASARAGFNAMRTAGRALADARIEGNALTNLGMLDKLVGDPLSAIAHLREARRLYRSIDYHTGEQNALGQLGTAYAALGEPGLAFAAMDSALHLSRDQKLRQEEASNLALIADLYRDAGDLRRALQFYAQAQAIHDSLGLQVERGTILRNEADIQAQLGRIDVARARAAQALQLHRAAGARFEELRDLAVLAELAQSAGRSTDATAHLRTAERLAERLDALTARVETVIAKARVADRAGSFRQVIQALHAARADLGRGDYRVEWETNALRARAYARLGILDSAAIFGRRAVAAVERVRANYGSGVLRSSYAAEKAATYSELVAVLVNLDRIDEAFEVADAARGRALLEHLPLRARGQAAASGLRAVMVREELLRQIDDLVARLDETEQTPPDERGQSVDLAAQALSAKLVSARSEYEELLIRTDARGLTAALLGAIKVSAREIRSALQPDEALLEYFAMPDRVLLFVVTSSGIGLVESSTANEDLASRVRIARELLAHRETATESNAVLSGLHGVLIEPAVRAGALRSARRLIVVPHSVLSYLPFAALRDSASGRFLAQQYALVHLPSAAALPALRSRARAQRSGRTDNARGSVYAPFPRSLPATQTEAEVFRRAVPRSTTFLAARATERSLRRSLSSEGTVHVATHAVMNARNPMFSRVELARGSTRGLDDDGRLEVHELLGLSVRSRLVVLSGCETGVGIAWSTQFERGEDYATLAQAFLYAGAGSVIATLWRIEDNGAAVFAERLYRQLRQAPPSEALVRAQREMLRDRTYGSPFYWAAYQLSGDAGLRQFARTTASIR